jgi:hypothetical protein
MKCNQQAAVYKVSNGRILAGSAKLGLCPRGTPRVAACTLALLAKYYAGMGEQSHHASLLVLSIRVTTVHAPHNFSIIFWYHHIRGPDICLHVVLSCAFTVCYWLHGHVDNRRSGGPPQEEGSNAAADAIGAGALPTARAGTLMYSNA